MDRVETPLQVVALDNHRSLITMWQAYANLLAPQCILAGMTLSFLGLGVGELSSGWGNMFAELEQYHVLDSYWWMSAPGFVPIPVSLSYLLPANALQERGKLHRPQALRCAV